LLFPQPVRRGRRGRQVENHNPTILPYITIDQMKDFWSALMLGDFNEFGILLDSATSILAVGVPDS